MIKIRFFITIFIVSFCVLIFMPKATKISAESNTCSGVLIQGKWTYTFEDDVMIWMFWDNGICTTTMEFQNEICNISGTDISLNLFDWTEQSDEFMLEWMNNYSVKEIVFSNTVTGINTYLFSVSFFGTAKRISLSEKTQVIGDEAFVSSCMQGLVLPESLLKIGVNAFNACENLTDVTVLSKNVLLNDSGIGYSDSKILDNMVIRGYLNSTAEAYANENGFTFVALDEPATTTTQTSQTTTTTTTTVTTTVDSSTSINTSTEESTTTDTQTTAVQTTTAVGTTTPTSTTGAEVIVTTEISTVPTTVTTPAVITTGTGTNLPQTGYSIWYQSLVAVAMGMVGVGSAVIVRSGVFRKKDSNS